MQRHIILAVLAASLCVGCFLEDPPEGPSSRPATRQDAPVQQLLASALPIPAPAAAAELTPETKQRLREQLSEWKRSAGSGTLLLRSRGGVELVAGPTLETRVAIQVTGPLARTRVSQRFHNPGPGWAEGVYVFPLPDDAAVDHMRIRTASQVLEGVIQEKEEARETYERAKAEGRQASLVEQERPNVFTTQVANIGPDSDVTVEIEYQQEVRLDDGESSLRFPMVVGPRFVPGEPLSESFGTGWAPDTDRVPDASRVTPPVQAPGSAPINPVEITVDLAPGFTIDELVSPYHEIVSEERNGRTRVRLAAGTVPADRDFVLRWTPAPGDEPFATIFGETLGDDHYALVMVVPPDAQGAQSAPPPRELIFVVDTSGSMAGTSLAQAKAGLELALERLQPDDRFNVIEFNSETTALFPIALDADAHNLQRALDYVRGLESQGGTHILPAIELALAHQHASRGYLRQVVFLTDGSVANESELFEAIQRDIGNSRLFTIGIGSAPNSHFMRKAAQHGRGSFSHIGKPEEVADKMAGLFRKLESVVLRDVALELPDAQIVEQVPERIGDLYLGEPIVVALKLEEPLDTLVLEGRTGREPWRIEFDGGDVVQRSGVHVQWARSKIAALMDARVGVNDERSLEDLRDETVEVALEHHLVSAYTSLVAVDVTPVRRAYESLHTHALATNLPAGWDHGAVFGMAGTATNARLQLAIGFALVASGWLLRRRRVLT
jgi:Ca-activated chloride channel family protein